MSFCSRARRKSKRSLLELFIWMCLCNVWLTDHGDALSVSAVSAVSVTAEGATWVWGKAPYDYGVLNSAGE